MKPNTSPTAEAIEVEPALRCFKCKSEDVQQGSDGAFVCNKCEQKFWIFETDPSTLNEIQSCFLKFNFVSIKQLESLAPKGAGFERGDIVHAGFLAYYHLQLIGMDWETRRRKAMAFAEMKAAETTNLDVDDITNVLKSIGEYFVYYKDDIWKPIEVEHCFRKFIYEDNDLKLILSGKIDLRVDTGSQNNHLILPVDHKSGIDIAPNELSNQFMAYSHVSESNLFCVNKVGFQKGSEKQPAPPEKKFKRHIIPYTPKLLEHWLQNSIWWIKMALFCMENNMFPQNFTSCDKYSGCQFKPVCYSNPDNMEFKLQSLFKKRDKPWNPATADLPKNELLAILEKL